MQIIYEVWRWENSIRTEQDEQGIYECVWSSLRKKSIDAWWD